MNISGMLKEAVILAGGFGTRLKGVIDDRPKPMALISNKPFLEYLLIYLKNNGIQRVILCTGYKSEIISDYFGNKFAGLEVVYSVEKEPLGTGGAIFASLKHITSDDIIVLNGDTLFQIDLQNFWAFHKTVKAGLSVALRKINDGSRYGSVKVDDNLRITGFSEKSSNAVNVLINGGIYILTIKDFRKARFPLKFSFEKDYLEYYYPNKQFFGKEYSGYFIDIGIPETYQQAQTDFIEIFRM